MIYLFHRADGFYPIELQDDVEALASVKTNPGTLKVENLITGEIIFETPAADFNFANN